MRLRHSLHPFKLCAMIAIALLAAPSALAQTTVFTHQGKLEFDGVPANGSFDFQFKLFDAASGGAQQGATVEQLNITVSDGDYKVLLDFGAGAFPGPDRYLEVGYRLSGSSTYATQTPRQPITSAPYAIRSLVATSADSLSATCSSCVTSTQIQSVQGAQVTGNVAGSQISGAIPVASVPTGSANYIQNTTSQQSASNFNISGNGTAAETLSANLVNATTQYNLGGLRVLSSTQAFNLFVGINSGTVNTGGDNSFFGYAAGPSNTSGHENSFFGARAGLNNTTGHDNSFFGATAGRFNTGDNNSFFGSAAGIGNTTGEHNSFFGEDAGANCKTGSRNTFIGSRSSFDSADASGSDNTLLGSNTTIKSGINSATAIGSGAQATASHTVVLGTGQEVVIIPGKLEVDTLGVAGSQPLCLNNSKRLAPCSSSLRYKTALRPFAAGLSIINRLQPISFTWKEGGMRDLGFGAEAVARVEPLLVTRNAGGEIEGVKYDRVAVVMVNAIKEQQQQIAAQQEQVAELPLIKAENARLRAQLADVLARLGRLEMRLAARK